MTAIRRNVLNNGGSEEILFNPACLMAFSRRRRDEAEATPAWLWCIVKDVWVAVRKGISKRNYENGKDDDDGR